MPNEKPNCELCKLQIVGMEKQIDSLIIAVFKGDSRDRSIKDRVYATEFELSTVKESINSIAKVMREQASDKKKLMLVLIGGSIASIGSAISILMKG